MRLQLFKTDAGAYETVMWDETKMIPDPVFVRRFAWQAPPAKGEFVPVRTQTETPGGVVVESDVDYQARVDAAKNETDAEYQVRVAEHEEMIRQETQRAYQADLAKSASPALVDERAV